MHDGTVGSVEAQLSEAAKGLPDALEPPMHAVQLLGVLAGRADRGRRRGDRRSRPSAVAAGLATFAKLPAERLVWSIVERSRAFLDQSRDQEGAGHKLVEESVAASLEKKLRDEVREAEPSVLAQERDLLRLLFWINKTASEAEENVLVVPADNTVHATLLRNSLAEVRSQALGTRATSRTARLHWDALLSVVGSEEHIREMVEGTEELTANDPGLSEARELAQKYLEGWRPSDFGD